MNIIHPDPPRMVASNLRPIKLRDVASSRPSPCSLPRYSQPEKKARKNFKGRGGRTQPEPLEPDHEQPFHDVNSKDHRSSRTSNANQRSIHHHHDYQATRQPTTATSLKEHALAFFKLARVSDRRESRYNAHGNLASFHDGQTTMQNQKPKLYRNVFAGSEAIDSMVASGMVPSRMEALVLGNRLASEFNLFSRANNSNNNGQPGSSASQGHQNWHKGKARANLLAAQTILLGTNETSELKTSGPTSDTASRDGCFVDDANAFYRFGPGVLAILRDIDQTKSWNDTGLDRNLSIEPNAPGSRGKTALEDLFSVRKAAKVGNSPAKASKERENQNRPSKSSTKSTKKVSAPSVEPRVVPMPTPLLYPKSILKNGNSNNKNDEMKKKKKHKIASSKTKRGKVHKIKAGAKIKYISGKEQRIASIERRLSIFHSEQQVVLYRNMLRELETRLSRMYTGDHKIVTSYSSPLTPVPDKKQRKEHLIASSTNLGISLTGPLNIKNNMFDFGNKNDIHKKGTFDDALDSLEDIISKNSDLLAEGDDNISVWTEFIVGTSGIVAATPPPSNTENKAKPGTPQKEDRLPSEKPKTEPAESSKDIPRKEHSEIPEIDKSTKSGKKHLPVENRQQKSKKAPTNGWQAPEPLESGSSGRHKKTNKVCGFDSNEIDLSSWAMVYRENEGSRAKRNRHHPRNVEDAKTHTIPSKSHNHRVAAYNDIPDDISLMVAQEQERQRGALRTIHDQDVGDGSVPQERDGCKGSNRRHNVDHKKTGNAFPTSKTCLGRTMSFTDSMNGSLRSDLTKDSNELARLRVRARNDVPNNSDEEGVYRNYNLSLSDNSGDVDDSSDSAPRTPNMNDHCRAFDETSSSNSGIMEAIERDPFYQLAVSASMPEEKIEAANKRSILKNNKQTTAYPSDSSPIDLESKNDVSSSEPGSFTESYMDSYFDDTYDNFDGEEETYATYSDEESYMELTVNEDEEESDFEEIEEVIEEEIIEDDEEIAVDSEPNNNMNYNQFYKTISPPTPTLSPRRRTNKFQSARYLPPVPELGPEPEPEPKPASERSVYVEVYSMDDDMTQITMEGFSSFRSNRSLHIIPEDDYTINLDGYTNQNSYLNKGGSAIISPLGSSFKRTINNTGSKYNSSTQNDRHKGKQISSSSNGRGRNTVLTTETSQQRIQEILWKDLSNDDVTVVWSALEELRILVATEVRSRAYLVRNGGMMVVIDTMADHLEVEVIQFLCCNILKQLASLSVEMALTIHELGGSTLIKKAMKKHGGSRRIKEIGNAALKTLSHYQ